MAFDLDVLLSNEHALIRIAGSGVRVKGIAVGGFTAGGAAEYNSIFQSTLSTKLSESLAKIKFVAGEIPGADKIIGALGGVHMKSKWETTDFWVNTQKPTFSVDTVFIAIRRKDDVRSKVNQLWKCVYPQRLQDGALYGPPLGYLATRSGVTGTVDVSIGRWFYARQQIVKNVSATFSKELVAPGRPLYVEVKVDFEPYRVPDVEDMIGWFRHA
jgi:hypothetical protein